MTLKIFGRIFWRERRPKSFVTVRRSQPLFRLRKTEEIFEPSTIRLPKQIAFERCPRWVKCGHVQRKKQCPLKGQ
jgi:hypothetical protein